MGLAWPALCAPTPAGGRGQPARPQPAAATRQVGPDRRPGRCPGDPGRGDGHPKTGEGQVEMIWVLRVARRGAMKARGAAAEQLSGVVCSAPSSCASRCSAARPRPWSGPVRPCGPGPVTSTTAATRPPCGPGPPLAPAPGRARPVGPPAPGAGRRGRPALLACPESGRDRRPAAGHRGRHPQRLRSEAAFAHLCGLSPIPASSGRTDRHRLHRGVTAGPTTPCGASPWSACVATTNQGRCRAGDQPGPVQARHPALLEALHRPRGLPAPHQPATQHNQRLPEIEGTNELTSTDTTDRLLGPGAPGARPGGISG
jgi:transposase IS116/IS110/IS902 family protein